MESDNREAMLSDLEEVKLIVNVLSIGCKCHDYKDLVRLMILSLSASWQKSGLLQAPPMDLTIEKMFSTESERS